MIDLEHSDFRLLKNRSLNWIELTAMGVIVNATLRIPNPNLANPHRER